MNAPGAAQGKPTGEARELYMAFELGEKNWKLSLGDGAHSPSRYTVAAGDTVALLECIAKAKARCGCGEAGVHSCYEAGRDGFWLHRWLVAQGIDNIVVDSASIEVNRRARRVKTDLRVKYVGGRLWQRWWSGHAGELLPAVRAEIERESERLSLVQGQMRTIEAVQREALRDASPVAASACGASASWPLPGAWRLRCGATWSNGLIPDGARFKPIGG